MFNTKINKIMKVFVLFICTYSFLFIGCEDRNFLDPNNPSSVEQTTVQDLVTGIESGMRVNLEYYIRTVSVIGREAYYLEPSDPRYTGELLGKGGSDIDPSGFLLNRPWGSRYRVIRNCNFLLQKGDKGANGFAKTIMAYQYLLNLNLTDINGIRIDVTQDVPGPFVSKDDALIKISDLLDEGLADLNGAGDEFSFKLSSGFSGFDTPATFGQFNRALKARVLVYQKQYTEVLTALNGSFKNIAGSLTVGVYHLYSTGTNDVVNPIYEIPTASSVKFLAHPSFIIDAENNDTRVSSKTIIRNDTTKLDELSSYIGLRVVNSNTSPFPIIKNEELLLIEAEAHIGLGDYASAQMLLNSIRNAAGLPSVTLDANNAVDELLKQRRYSLFLEGHRWIDLRRYDKLSILPLDRSGDKIHVNTPRPAEEK